MKKLNICIFLLLFCLISAYSQSTLTDDETDTVEDTTASSSNAQAFRDITLGMSLEQVKDILRSDPYFNYHGDSDAYILPAKEQKLLECTGNSYVKRGYFQFHDNKLYIMIIELNMDKIDYYTLLTSLSAKYGKYSSFSPDAVIWQVNNVTLVLERPVTLKYIDTGIFNSLKDQALLDKSAENLSLERFLEQF